MKGDRVTQSDRILGYLMARNDWVSSLTFVQLKRPILSYTRRIHELRKAGHNIEGKDVGNIHFYRLIQP